MSDVREASTVACLVGPGEGDEVRPDEITKTKTTNCVMYSTTKLDKTRLAEIKTSSTRGIKDDIAK
eukprot:scaffold886_cov174-Ochromonas_danica.AAC.28